MENTDQHRQNPHSEMENVPDISRLDTPVDLQEIEFLDVDPKIAKGYIVNYQDNHPSTFDQSSWLVSRADMEKLIGDATVEQVHVFLALQDVSKPKDVTLVMVPVIAGNHAPYMAPGGLMVADQVIPCPVCIYTDPSGTLQTVPHLHKDLKF